MLVFLSFENKKMPIMLNKLVSVNVRPKTYTSC